MKEFGSESHFIAFQSTEKDSLKSYFQKGHLYADGRHAIQDLIINNLKSGKWKRIWMPEYFCYEVIAAIKGTGIEISFYQDSPLRNDVDLISQIKFKERDVLFRMNYFGLRALRNNTNIPVEVIEDHSHDLLSDWSVQSNADWCFASLRKTLPIPEGGILWSNKHDIETISAKASTTSNDNISYKKLSGMLLKRLYLDDFDINKEDFRRLMVEAERELDQSSISGISDITKNILCKLPINYLYKRKKENWGRLFHILTEKGYLVLKPEDFTNGTPFSIALKFDDIKIRNAIRKDLIQNDIYPAILWDIPHSATQEIWDLGETLLSIHCDIRYNETDIELLGQKIVDIMDHYS